MTKVVDINSGVKKDELPEDVTSVTDFINDEKCIAVALESTQQIQKLCGSKWFDAVEVVNKFGIGLSDAIQKLQALKLFGFIYERTLDGKVKEYKVCLTDKHRLVLIQKDIKFYEDKVKILKKAEEKMRTKIANVN